MAQPGTLGAGHPRTGPGAGHAIHQLPTPAHPAVQTLLERFRAAAPGAAAITGGDSAAVSHRTGARLLPERSGPAAQPAARSIGRLIGTAIRRPVPTIPGLIHGPRLPAAARQPALPAQAHQRNGDPTPLQGPKEGGHGRLALGPTLREPADCERLSFRPPPTQTPAGNWHPSGRHGSARSRSGRPDPGGGGGRGRCGRSASSGRSSGRPPGARDRCDAR